MIIGKDTVAEVNNIYRDPTSDLAKLHLGFDVSEFVLSIPAEKRAGRKFDYNNFNSQVIEFNPQLLK